MGLLNPVVESQVLLPENCKTGVNLWSVLVPPLPNWFPLPSLPPALHFAVVKDGAGEIDFHADTATAVRPVPRSIGVDERCVATFAVGTTIAQLDRNEYSYPSTSASPLSRMAQVW
jgi:hypothetical protein